MKREIHYYFYPGCLVVGLVLIDDSGLMNIYDVARLHAPWSKSESKWDDEAHRLTDDERNQIERDATKNLKEWCEWSFNPNRETNIEYHQKVMMERHWPKDYECIIH